MNELKKIRFYYNIPKNKIEIFLNLKLSLTTDHMASRLILLLFQTDASNGKTTYRAVKSFLKRQPAVIMNYRTITTFRNETLSLSGSHLIYARQISNAKFTPMLVLHKSSKMFHIFHGFPKKIIEYTQSVIFIL